MSEYGPDERERIEAHARRVADQRARAFGDTVMIGELLVASGGAETHVEAPNWLITAAIRTA